MRNYSYENDFDLHENEPACRTHFHMKGFALRLILKQRNNRTRKWPIELSIDSCYPALLITKKVSSRGALYEIPDDRDKISNNANIGTIEG